MIEEEVSTEVNAAAAARPSTGNPTHPQPEILPAALQLPLRLQQERVVGTVVLETKLGSVTQNAPSTIPSTQLKSRETAKGADVCERGHPLLLIKRSQRSPICA